ncbi:toxin biosynthesis protein [Thozetella sp. PMI_491]|nr:toxin biosynthesis protein [Thozetella sp. PMI_491]
MPRPAVAIHFTSLAVQLLFLSAPSFPARRTVAVFLITLLAVAPHFVEPASDVPGDAQPFALLWPIYLGSLDKFLGSTAGRPEDSYWRVDRPAREANAMKPLSFAKLKWAAAMMFNTRGVRWNYEVAKLPRGRAGRTKWSFLLVQVVEFTKMLLMTDLLLQLSELFFWTPRPEDSKYLTITHADWRWSFLKVLVFACGPYFFVNWQYVGASIVAVAINLSKPEDWPPYFGDVSEVTTVRHFWGSFWHQTLRRTFTKLTGFVVDRLGIRRGTNLSSYLQIWIAFAFSGFMHAQSMLLLPRPPNITATESTVGVMAFFLWQAAAITAEDLAQWLWRKVSGDVMIDRRIRKWLGYSWVILSFWISLPWAADVMMRIRLTEESFLGFSLVKGLVQHIPIPP